MCFLSHVTEATLGLERHAEPQSSGDGIAGRLRSQRQYCQNSDGVSTVSLVEPSKDIGTESRSGRPVIVGIFPQQKGQEARLRP
jgi:hypothetical protein